jgi:hypothetical protein
MRDGIQRSCRLPGDLYAMADRRNKGLITGALVEVRSFCEKVGIRALTVEVVTTTVPRRLYIVGSALPRLLIVNY